MASFGFTGALWLRMKIYQNFIKNLVPEDFYHKKIKRPICRVNVKLRRGFRNLNFSLIGEEEWKDYARHASSVTVSDYSNDPYEKLPIMPIENRIKFCNKKISDIRKRAHAYFAYTSNRLKKEDIYELCLYKRELQNLEENRE
jgi:hypothetical protein